MQELISLTPDATGVTVPCTLIRAPAVAPPVTSPSAKPASQGQSNGSAPTTGLKLGSPVPELTGGHADNGPWYVDFEEFGMDGAVPTYYISNGEQDVVVPMHAFSWFKFPKQPGGECAEGRALATFICSILNGVKYNVATGIQLQD